jgi:hypothetical protein
MGTRKINPLRINVHDLVHENGFRIRDQQVRPLRDADQR